MCCEVNNHFYHKDLTAFWSCLKTWQQPQFGLAINTVAGGSHPANTAGRPMQHTSGPGSKYHLSSSIILLKTSQPANTICRGTPWEIWAHWSASDSNSLIFHMNVLRNDSGMGNEIPLYFTNLENKFPINITEEENQFTWNLLLKSLKMYKRCFSASLDNHK